jgi:uncharacterized repeat protein (TIGR01451 family)
MRVSNWSAISVLLLAGNIGAVAWAAEPVTNTLTVHRIAVLPGGEEKIETASSAKPGELLEYIAEFHNASGSTARAFSATLPLPAGTEFIPASPHPAGALASVDGVTYEPMPLKRKARQPDGTQHDVLVPLSEYRFLRWPATDLPPGGNLSFSARVAIASDKTR